MVIAKEKKFILGTGIGRGVLTAVFCLVCCAGAMAAGSGSEPSVTVTGRGAAWSDAVALGLSDLIPFKKSIQAVDPNFARDGSRVFTGVALVRLLGLAGLDNRDGLTVIGADQYVGYLPPGRVAQGMLVWEVDGRPVSALKGGPLKLMFPEGAGVHASCFTWYVTGLVQGCPAAPDLIVSAGGREQRYPLSEMAVRAEPLPSYLVSIAQGCRNEFAEPAPDKLVRAVPLSRLTGDLSRDACVELVPYYGQAIRLKPQALGFDARIVVSCGDRPLHPALGGPYAVVFPVEDHHELRSFVPESGAFFFLKAIVVD